MKTVNNLGTNVLKIVLTAVAVLLSLPPIAIAVFPDLLGSSAEPARSGIPLAAWIGFISIAGLGAVALLALAADRDRTGG